MFESVLLSPEQFPLFLQQLAQWVCWFKVDMPNGKQKKMAVKPAKLLQINQERLDYTNPKNWSSLELAVRCWQSNPHAITGVGFVFTALDQCRLVDLDGVISEAGVLEYAKDLVALLDSYTEISQSGKGLHILLRSHWSAANRVVKPFPLEVYGAPRWVAFTGRHVCTTSLDIEQREGEMLLLEETYFKKEVGERPPDVFTPSQKTAFSRKAALTDDHALLEKMFGWKNGNRLKLLFYGDVVGAGFVVDGKADQSRADMSLLSALMFLAGGDRSRAVGLFQRSALYSQERWNRNATSSGVSYGQLTLSKITSSV
jgi:putative DNA primase/helicase